MQSGHWDRWRWVKAAMGSACIALCGAQGKAQTLAVGTAIPVVLTRTLEAGRVKAGDPVKAKTMQVVMLPGGRVIAAGAEVAGHVVESSGFHFDATAYTTQKASVLALHFDTIAVRGTKIAVSLGARAVAGAVASHEAAMLRSRDETDTTGTRVLVGGAEFSPWEGVVTAPSGAAEGYNRSEGVFARLIAAANVSPESSASCEGTESEQAVGIFSADVCGVYGLPGVMLTKSGAAEGGTFGLESRQQSVALHAGSTALLQVRER